MTTKQQQIIQYGLIALGFVILFIAIAYKSLYSKAVTSRTNIVLEKVDLPLYSTMYDYIYLNLNEILTIIYTIGIIICFILVFKYYEPVIDYISVLFNFTKEEAQIIADKTTINKPVINNSQK